MGSKQSAASTRVLERPEGASLVVRRCVLELLSGPERGRKQVFDRTALRVGSDPDNDLALADVAVSSHHLEISVREDGFLLRDLGSTNGTFVDGLRIREIYLTRSAEIVAGETRMRFAVSDDEVEIRISRSTSFGGLLGHSPAMRAAFAVLEQAAITDATVLVIGESGTGKELAAQAVHERSKRAGGPYMVFDCGAAAPSLVESQLFGHARGAFTGAVEARAGVFEEAEGGTVVLDEIGELPLELQPKLLRVLEARAVQRVGEVKSRHVDVRFVASTNKNLDQEVRAGRFRQDLFYRLNVVTVRLPPLRERKEEIPRLVRHFVARFGGEDAPEPPPLLLTIAAAYDWPGNVRELRNFVERWLALPGTSPSSLLPAMPETAPASAAGALPFHEAKRIYVDEFERRYLEGLLETHERNISGVARAAGISRQSCYRLMKKHGLDSGEGA